MNDHQLREELSKLNSGDKSALERIYREFSTPVYTMILRMTGDRETAEDILQEYFVKLYLSPPQGMLRNPKAYLYRMARNLAIDMLRKRRDAIDIETVELCDKSEDDRAERMDLENAVRLLEETDRAILVLRINGDLKFREIAETVGMPLGTVLWRYHRAIGKLQKLLSGGEI